MWSKSKSGLWKVVWSTSNNWCIQIFIVNSPGATLSPAPGNWSNLLINYANKHLFYSRLLVIYTDENTDSKTKKLHKKLNIISVENSNKISFTQLNMFLIWTLLLSAFDIFFINFCHLFGKWKRGNIFDFSEAISCFHQMFSYQIFQYITHTVNFDSVQSYHRVSHKQYRIF